MRLSMRCRLYSNRSLAAGKLKERDFLVLCVQKTEISNITEKNGCLEQVDLNYG